MVYRPMPSIFSGLQAFIPSLHFLDSEKHVLIFPEDGIKYCQSSKVRRARTGFDLREKSSSKSGAL
jgi:hypothetical protein